MSRWEFMRNLEELLADISPNEREEALQYYNDYFNDAGKENEEEVVAALGTPEQVAVIVKEGLSDNLEKGEFTEKGFRNTATVENEVAKRNPAFQSQNGQTNQTEQTHQQTAEDAYAKEKDKKEPMPTWAVVLIVVLCVFFSPVIVSLAGAALATMFSIIVGAFALVLGFSCAFIALLISAVILVVLGISQMFVAPLEGIAILGAGLICAAIGLLFLLLTVFIVGVCIPGIFKGIKYIFRSIFGKKGGEKA